MERAQAENGTIEYCRQLEDHIRDLEYNERRLLAELRKRTLELSEQHGRLNTSIRNLPLGFLMFDKRYKIVRVNPAGQTLLGFGGRLSEISEIEKRLNHIFDIQTLTEMCVQENRTVYREDVPFGNRTLRFHLTPITQLRDFGETIGAILLIEDITDQKLLEHSKDDFVSITTHHLRTPLAEIKGSIERLSDERTGPLNGEQRKVLGHIYKATEQMLGLVKDFLDIRKVERGGAKTRLTDVDVAETLRSVIGGLSAYAAKEGVSVSLEAPESERYIVEADETRLKQVFENLISNGIRYRKKNVKHAEVSVACRNDNGTVTVAVTDNGIGIPEAERAKIFERFYRASNAMDIGGTGLGLYGVREIVTQLKGRAWFDSTEGVGTTFFVELPIKK